MVVPESREGPSLGGVSGVARQNCSRHAISVLCCGVPNVLRARPSAVSTRTFLKWCSVGGLDFGPLLRYTCPRPPLASTGLLRRHARVHSRRARILAQRRFLAFARRGGGLFPSRGTIWARPARPIPSYPIPSHGTLSQGIPLAVCRAALARIAGRHDSTASHPARYMSVQDVTRPLEGDALR